jgi:hypothetical protein
MYVDPGICQFCHQYIADSWKDLPLAATPEFSILRHVTPGALRGMISADTPDRPSPPVRTAAVQ